MPRVAPDANDLAVWKLDEAAAPFVNSTPSTDPGIAGSLGTLVSVANLGKTDPLLRVCGPYGPGSYAVMFQGTNSRAGILGANSFRPPAPITISMWIKLFSNSPTGFTQHFMRKQHTTSVWGPPYSSVSLNNRVYAGDELHWECGVNPGAGDPSVVVSRTRRLFLGHWNHIGMTFSGTVSQLYQNGVLVGQSAPIASTTIVYDTSGSSGPWFIGAIPAGSGASEPAHSCIADWRVANIVRPASYFRNIYDQAMLYRTGNAT